MYCRNCGKEIQEGSNYCPICGAKQNVSYENNNVNNTNDNKVLNQKCLIGICLSGISLLINFYGAVGLAGLIVSYKGYKEIDSETEKGKELALIGMIIGGLTGVLGLLYVLFAYSAGIGVMSFINNIF